ncbi:MAG: hypothetical protein U0T02_14535 [Solirubrobacteraceae bacterium]
MATARSERSARRPAGARAAPAGGAGPTAAERRLGWGLPLALGLLAAALLVTLIAAGSSAIGVPGGPASAVSGDAAVFASLRPAVAPRGWSQARTATGATLPYPPGWRRIPGDAGSATAALGARGGAIAGYLNATPRSGAESIGNWRRFRPAHNAAEGDRDVRLLAAASGLRIGSGAGSCVLDTYSTTTRAHYEELACIVHGAGGTTVYVGAAPPRRWAAVAPVLERALAATTGRG